MRLCPHKPFTFQAGMGGRISLSSFTFATTSHMYLPPSSKIAPFSPEYPGSQPDKSGGGAGKASPYTENCANGI